MSGKLSLDIKYLIISILLISVFTGSLFSQTKISGIINKYGRVTSKGTDFVIVADEVQFDQFSQGDTVLLMQMKGARIYASESPTYGTAYLSYGQPGRHEFLTILSVDDAINKIIFRNNIVNTTFDIESGIQIIKVPSFNTAVVNAVLTCQPWDSVTKTGGVLAVITGKTLSLNANIDVSGKGFKGGAVAIGKGICSSTNTIKLDEYAYSAFSDSSGFKGEGLTIRVNAGAIPYPSVYPFYAKGKGANFTGGGGGNGKYSGGGGGSNYGNGGLGGRESSTCTPPLLGGEGGKDVVSTGLNGGFFPGGGGGSSTYLAGGTPTPGGNGGGIVILLCDTLKGNNYSILADGRHPGTATGEAGSGGGGGGGSIGLYLQNYSSIPAESAIIIAARGGQGGNNLQNAGNGGGGGGGVVLTNSIAAPANVIRSVTGGAVGTRGGGTSGGATTGLNGVTQNTFVPLLNGFLFNSIRSSVTGTQIDSICSNVIPKPVTGTSPVGGSGSYQYIWQKSYNLAVLPAVIATATARDYTPAAIETSTFWVRRIIRDVVTTLTDTSKWVKIIVQPAITGNLVGKDTTICYNQNPLPLKSLNSGPSNGNGIYQYQWKQNYDNTGWTTSPDASGSASDLPSFDPPALMATTYFRRVVTSGRCVDTGPTVTVTVLPSVTGNITARPDSVICEGKLFNTLGATAATGGSGGYVYLWQDSTATGSWQPASGVNNGPTHLPDTSRFAAVENRYFRRVVYSGPYNVCKNAASPILLTRYFKIENNNISSDNTICAGTVPTVISGSIPIKGSGAYTYIWQDSSQTATWTSRATSLSPYAPPALSDSIWYRRIVNSSKCSDTSNLVVINVHAPVTDNIISLISGPAADTTLCSGSVPNRIIELGSPTGGTNIPGDYAYQWFFSSDNISYTPVAVAGTLDNYQPAAAATSMFYRRRVSSGLCSSESNSIKINVLPAITNNVITPDKSAVCYNTVPGQLTGTPLSGGTGSTQTWLWQDSTSGAIWADISGSNVQSYTPAGGLTKKTWFRRIIKSGPFDCCSDTSVFKTIDINPLPAGTITSVTDTTMCSGSSLGLKVHLTGASGWTVIFNENTVKVPVSGITSADPLIKLTPSATGPSTVINYSLASVEDQNGCFATSLTGARKATVYRAPVANAGPDVGVCGPGVTLAAVPSDGTGLWSFTPQVIQSVPSAYNTAIKIDSSFNTASVSYKFYWEEKNWLCSDKDSVTITFYNRINGIDAGRDTSLMSFDYMTGLKASLPLNWETGEWSVVSGSGDFDNKNANETFVRNIGLGLNSFKWTISNGECVLEDVVNINVLSLVIPGGISPNGDNINDSLIINGLDLSNQVVELTIVNGAGTKVFSTSNGNGGRWRNWDGKNSSGVEIPEGTYYYLLKVTSSRTGLVVPKSGFIILRRN